MKGPCIYVKLFRELNFWFWEQNPFSGPLEQYKDLIKQGKLQHDPYQESVAIELENLLGRLEQYEKDMEEYHVLHMHLPCLIHNLIW